MDRQVGGGRYHIDVADLESDELLESGGVFRIVPQHEKVKASARSMTIRASQGLFLGSDQVVLGPNISVAIQPTGPTNWRPTAA